MYRIKRYVGLPVHMFMGKSTVDSTVFQSPDIQKAYYSRAWIYGIREKKLPCTYVVLADKRPVLLFPALASKNEIQLAGSTNGICSLCPIYFGEQEFYEEVLQYCLQSLPVSKIVMDRIPEDSRTARFVRSITKWAEVDSVITENVRIPFNNGYEIWHSTLRKSVRQNLRTAYNRLKTDGLSMRFEMHMGGEVSTALMKQLVEVYNNRHEIQYGVKTTKLKRLYMEKFDFSTLSLKNNQNARHGIIHIDNNIAGFFSGYYDAGLASIVIPRLSIDPKYGRYSPGYLLINEAIKWFEKDEKVQCLDLSTGCEKYKLDLGGEIYLKGKYTITKI